MTMPPLRSVSVGRPSRRALTEPDATVHPGDPTMPINTGNPALPRNRAARAGWAV
jgi:hypothetical protein